MSAAVPGEHPGADLLADLAADALPTEQALEAEQHVIGCAHCAGLLAEAEGVRSLLLADPVAPMPTDVAARLEAALRKESLWAAAQTVEGPAVPAAAARTGSEAANGLPPTGSLPQESFFSEPFPTAAIPAGSIPVGAPATGSRMLRRPSRGPERTRRQVRDEERDSRPIWARPMFAIAAGIVAVAGVGVLAQQVIGGSPANRTTADSAAGGSVSAPELQSAPVPVLATGTDYDAKKLPAQAKALVAKAQAAADSVATPKALAESDAVAGTSALPTATRAAAPAGAAGQLLRDPAALEACLTAIDSAGVRPLAVDLATYQKREAAILVLPGAGGGIEVWAVSRSCKPGADGTLVFKTVS